LLIGLLKGLVAGIGIGAAFHFGLGWKQTSGLLGFLIAMGAGGTTGLLTGRPPWQHQAWVEGVLKAVFGVGVGALLYWLAVRFAPLQVPLSALGLPEGKPWTSSPLLFAPPITALYGALVELDNTDGREKKAEGDTSTSTGHG
jgi:hypothetical protein